MRLANALCRFAELAVEPPSAGPPRPKEPLTLGLV
jgi:hypothetical protein